MKTIIFYEVQTDNNGCISKRGGQSSFETEYEATDFATEFKKNPRNDSPYMTDDNVKYWSNKVYTIVKKTIITETLKTI